MALQGAALMRATTILAAVGFLLFGYDQVCHFYYISFITDLLY